MTAQYYTCTTICHQASPSCFCLLLPFVFFSLYCIPSLNSLLLQFLFLLVASFSFCSALSYGGFMVARWWLLGLERQGFLAKSSLLGRVLVLFYRRKRRVLGFMSWRDLNSLFFGGDQHHWWQLRVSFCLVLRLDTVGYCYVFIAFGKYIWLVRFGFCCILWRVLRGKEKVGNWRIRTVDWQDNKHGEPIRLERLLWTLACSRV